MVKQENKLLHNALCQWVHHQQTHKGNLSVPYLEHWVH
jgi:hypothetical protein